MGRPPKFTREQVQAAALAIVDQQGVAALTMRALATSLGTGPMTLYNHVTDREHLDVLVVDAVVSQVRWTLTAHADWPDDVRTIATALWQVLRAHPHVVPLVAARRSRSPAMLGVVEALLGALARSGRSDADLLVAFRAVTALVMGFAQVELAGPLSLGNGDPAELVIARFRRLPAADYPRLIEIAVAASSSDPEVEFREGLALLLNGLAGSGTPATGR